MAARRFANSGMSNTVYLAEFDLFSNKLTEGGEEEETVQSWTKFSQ